MQSVATPLMDRLIARTVLKRLPLSVHFDLTYRCNERCVHCYLDHEDHGELSTAECIDALEQLAKAGTLFLTFSGGEIFLRKDLEELLAAARRLHFDVSLKTNALLVTPERAEMLSRHGVRRVQISVYSSDAAIHDAITKVPGSLARSIAAIPLLQQRGILVKLACPLMKQNLMAYRGVLALAENLGVPYVLDMTITPMMDGSDAPLDHRVSVDALLPVLQDSTLQSCGTKVASEDGFAPAFLEAQFRAELKMRHTKTCPVAQATIVVIFRRTATCTLAYNCRWLPAIYANRAFGKFGTVPRHWNGFEAFERANCRFVRNATFVPIASVAPVLRGWKAATCLERMNARALWPNKKRDWLGFRVRLALGARVLRRPPRSHSEKASRPVMSGER